MRRVTLIVGMLLLGTTIPALAQDSTAAKAEVLAAVQKLFDGMRARDTVALAQVMDTTARLVTTFGSSGAPDMDITAVNQFIHLVATSAPGQLLDERLENPEVRVEDNLASVWVHYRFYLGTRFSHCGIDAFQLARTISGWKIIALADTRRPAAACGS